MISLRNVYWPFLEASGLDLWSHTILAETRTPAVILSRHDHPTHFRVDGRSNSNSKDFWAVRAMGRVLIGVKGGANGGYDSNHTVFNRHCPLYTDERPQPSSSNLSNTTT